MPPDKKDLKQKSIGQLDSEVAAASRSSANTAQAAITQMDQRDADHTTRDDPGTAVRKANENAAAQARVMAGDASVPANGPQNGQQNGQGDGRVANPAGTPGSIESDAVRMKRMELENALRVKGIDTALSIWKEQTARENALRDREMAFEEWKQRTAITERDRVARLAATSFKRSYHGTFSGGFLSSSWAGPKVNPYKALLDKLESQIGGNPYAAGPEGRRAPSAPDWLRPLLPDGSLGERRAMNPGVRAGVSGREGLPEVDLSDWDSVRSAVNPGGVAIRAVRTFTDRNGGEFGGAEHVRVSNPGFTGVRRSFTDGVSTVTRESRRRRQ